MLTKSLVRYRLAKGVVHPRWVDPNQGAMRTLAASMIDLFQSSLGQPRDSLQHQLAQVIETHPQKSLILKGLEKLLLDRTDFDSCEDKGLQNFREAVFEKTSFLLQNRSFTTLEEYYQTMRAELGDDLNAIREKLYSDLPQHHPVVKFKPITPEMLLHRYNCSLVQWLLLNSRSLTIELSQTNPSRLRQVAKYLRFHQLLAQIKTTGKDCFQMKIDGPLNLFFEVKKYGLNLAQFFPVLLHQPRWHLTAEIHIAKRKRGQLTLDQNIGIRPTEERFHAYIPEEFKTLEQNFNQSDAPWTMVNEAEFLPMKENTYCFPDYKLVHDNGQIAYLELFHGWHETSLKARLREMEANANYRLLLGVSRKLVKKPALKSCLESSSYFKKNGFLFSVIPSPKQVLKLLQPET